MNIPVLVPTNDLGLVSAIRANSVVQEATVITISLKTATRMLDKTTIVVELDLKLFQVGSTVTCVVNNLPTSCQYSSDA